MMTHAIHLLTPPEAREKRDRRTTLDTETGRTGERLHVRLGWTRFGNVPGYATSPDGSARDEVSFFYKRL